MLIAETSVKVVVFQLGEEEYALPVGQVNSSEKWTDILVNMDDLLMEWMPADSPI